MLEEKEKRRKKEKIIIIIIIIIIRRRLILKGPHKTCADFQVKTTTAFFKQQINDDKSTLSTCLVLVSAGCVRCAEVGTLQYKLKPDK